MRKSNVKETRRKKEKFEQGSGKIKKELTLFFRMKNKEANLKSSLYSTLVVKQGLDSQRIRERLNEKMKRENKEKKRRRRNQRNKGKTGKVKER